MGPNTRSDITDVSNDRSCTFAVENNSTAVQPPIAAMMNPSTAMSRIFRKRGIVLGFSEGRWIWLWPEGALQPFARPLDWEPASIAATDDVAAQAGSTSVGWMSIAFPPVKPAHQFLDAKP